jgi:hypothetical protein
MPPASPNPGQPGNRLARSCSSAMAPSRGSHRRWADPPASQRFTRKALGQIGRAQNGTATVRCCHAAPEVPPGGRLNRANSGCARCPDYQYPRCP